MAAMAAGRRLLHLRPELELCLRSRPLVLLPSRAKGAGLLRHEPPRRRFVSCRPGASEEGDVAKDKAMSISDELLSSCKYGNALEPIENNSPDEFLRLPLEEGNNELVCGSIVSDVEKTAIELLAGRAFTVSELRKKLCGRRFPVNIVDSVVADFKSRGLLNDGYYAESFSRSRWLSSTWGPKRIKQALRQKGVSEAEMEQATRRVFQDDRDHQTMYGISEASLDHLFAQASKQWRRGQSLSLENRRARMVRWLQYRGFNWGLTNTIIRKLEKQHPS